MYTPYSYHLEEIEGVYRFIFSGVSHVRYAAYFVEASGAYTFDLPEYLTKHAFSFGITPIGEHEDLVTPLDLRIKFTIKSIIEDFFNNYQSEAILLLHYDDYDGRELKRFNCFSKWFRELHEDTQFCKEDAEINIPDHNPIKVSAILKLNHPFFETILQEFHETKNSFIDEEFKS